MDFCRGTFTGLPRAMAAAACLAVWTPTAGAERITASTPEAAQAALDRAGPGDEVVLAPGRYADLRLTLSARGSTTAPVVLRGEAPGSVVLTGSPAIRITGSQAEVRDLVFEDCDATTGSRGAVVFDGASRSRLTGCVFERCRLGQVSLVAFRGRASDNRVDHCRFSGNRYRCVTVVVDDGSLRDGPPVRNRIDSNLFEDVPPLGRNGGETLQIGQRAAPHSDLRTSTVVEHNVFIRCDGEREAISVKTTGNTLRQNLFLECEGELVLRHGHENVVEGNSFVRGSGGIRISGHGHRVRGNTVAECTGIGIRLSYGTPDEGHPASYLPVYGCRIEGNIITACGEAGILIGDRHNARYENQRWSGPPWFASAVMECTVPPHDNVIENNLVTGRPDRLIQVVESPGNVVRNNVLRGEGK